MAFHPNNDRLMILLPQRKMGYPIDLLTKSHARHSHTQPAIISQSANLWDAPSNYSKTLYYVFMHEMVDIVFCVEYIDIIIDYINSACLPHYTAMLYMNNKRLHYKKLRIYTSTCVIAME